MVAIGAVLVVVSFSVLATRLGAIALGATGLSWEAARFQARSAFTSVAFTTSEAESITDHAARRRVVSWLLFLGNAGIVSIIASLVLGFSDAGAREATQRLGVLVAGLLVLLALVRSRWLANQKLRDLDLPPRACRCSAGPLSGNPVPGPCPWGGDSSSTGGLGSSHERPSAPETRTPP